VLKLKNMAFGLIRVRNLKIEDIQSTDNHNARLYDSELDYPRNIDPNGRFVANYQSGEKLINSLNNRIESLKVQGIKKNTNVAIEFVVGINDQRAWSNYPPSEFFQKVKEWLQVKHGKTSVIGHYEHYDESNPHAHFVVLPVTPKEIKWKNSKGEGVRKENRIETRKFTGGRDKLRSLQTEFYEFCKDLEPSLGVPIYRGTLKENQTKEYVQSTNHEIGLLRAKISTLTDDLEIVKANYQLKEKELELAKLHEETAKIEEEKGMKKGNWERKGLRDNPVIFHSEPIGERVEPNKPKPKKGFSM
jgi:hypothetical protein